MSRGGLQAGLRLVRQAAEFWALAGGLLLLAVVLVNAWSLIGDQLLGRPVRGVFEIVEIGVAVAVFCFLPYCQVSGANVSADIFTARAGPRALAAFAFLASLVALAFSLLLLWRMYLGLLDFRRYQEVTTIYQFPLWIAFLPILVSLALLVLACLVTLLQAARGESDPGAGLAADPDGR